MNLLGVIPPKKINIFIVSFLLGLFLALSFEPFKVPFLSLLIIGIYFLLNDTVFKSFQNYHKIFFYNGILFGFGFFLLSMYWVSNSILELNDKLFYIAPIILIFLPFCLSIFFGIMQLINSFMWSTSNSKLLYFSSLWTIFELLRSALFTGLPWNLIGYSWSWSLSFSQSVSIFGIYGLGLITVFGAVCIFSYITNSKNFFYVITGVLIFLLLYIYGISRLNNYQIEYSENNIRIVHTYFDQKDKWASESISQIMKMGSYNMVTVFPETSLRFDANKPENWIVGYIRKDQNNFFNSINYLGFTYDKKILVPFGEYFPFSKFLNILFPENLFFKNEISKGDNDQEFPSNLSPLICYEVIFPNFVRDSLTDNTNLLVNISNDGWFGDFSGPRQHFVHAQFRSIELGIPMVRSSNKGISGLIGPMGEIINATNSRKITYLDLKIPKKLEATVYRQYGNIITYFLIVLFFIIGYAVRSKQ